MYTRLVSVVFVLLAAFMGVFIANANYTTEVAGVADEIVRQPITIKIVAHRVSNGPLATVRDHEDIERVLREAQEIWEQAEIDFNYEIVDTNIDFDDQQQIRRENYRVVYPQEYYEEGVINIFFVNFIPANGIAIYPSAAFVNDRTSVHDFRATAHEVGHLLGLQHTRDSRTRLLYQGVNGSHLTPAEIEIARAGTQAFK